LGHQAVVDMLLVHAEEHGMRQLNLGAADSGDTALMLAAFHGHVAVVERLLAASAATEVPSQCGDTALMAAAVAGHDGI
ncbi:ankyrin repeat domain-containing protein, partial [Acinetobacter baumannii]